jgi:uroporphyrinogen-III synthase
MKRARDPGGLVVLTREAGNNGKLRALLEERGVRSMALPCITHAAAEGLPTLAGALNEHWKYVVVTSPHAANVLIKVWLEIGKPPLAVACVGKGTKAALAVGGIGTDFVPSNASAEALITEIPASLSTDAGGSRVLYPTSALACSTIEDGLKEKVSRLASMFRAHTPLCRN